MFVLILCRQYNMYNSFICRGIQYSGIIIFGIWAFYVFVESIKISHFSSVCVCFGLAFSISISIENAYLSRVLRSNCLQCPNIVGMLQMLFLLGLKCLTFTSPYLLYCSNEKSKSWFRFHTKCNLLTNELNYATTK